MKIITGTKMPSFNAVLSDGTPFNSSDLEGQKVLLSFYRYAACPFCNLRMHHIDKKYSQEYAPKGMKMIVVFHSSIRHIEKHQSGRNWSFPIIADPKMKLYRLFGIKKSYWGLAKSMLRSNDIKELMKLGLFKIDPRGSIHTLPSDFLINEEGIVEVAYRGKDIGDHIPLEQVDAWLGEG